MKNYVPCFRKERYTFFSLLSERDEMEKELDAVRRALVEKEVRQSVVMDERDRWKAEVQAVILVATATFNYTAFSL